MKTRRTILLIDLIVNLILGILLIAYSTKLAGYLGVPVVESSFYPNILGGVFIGIAIALLIETCKTKSAITSGLGLLGAISINLCGGCVLLFWLIFGDLNLPIHGAIFLWILDILLLVLSLFELINHYRLQGI
jgi:hypothetical protein